MRTTHTESRAYPSALLYRAETTPTTIESADTGSRVSTWGAAHAPHDRFGDHTAKWDPVVAGRAPAPMTIGVQRSVAVLGIIERGHPGDDHRRTDDHFIASDKADQTTGQRLGSDR